MQEQAEQVEQEQHEQAAQQQEQQATVEFEGARPSVSPSETSFRDYETSVWANTTEDDTATFALDADRASWSIAVNYVKAGHFVEPASVRAEEWINAHDYEYNQPDALDEFGVTLDLIPHPLDEENLHLLRIGMQAPVIERTHPVNVIFVADASGSMAEGNRIDIARATLQALEGSLIPDLDRVGIIQFSVDPIPSSFVPHTRPGSEFLQASIDRLLPYYGTNVQAGINLGMQLANDARQAWPESDNYVVLISDGVANVDATDPFAILRSAGEEDENNPIRLITVGVGIGHYNDVLLEQLAQYGNGWYYYMDSPEQAWETFTPENWLRLSTPFADQTRAQIRWSSETVAAWRVIGYENRRTSDESFEEERKEFAEISSGAAVTIFVELELTSEAQSQAFDQIELGDVEVRWRTPRSDESNRQEHRLAITESATPDPLLQLGAIVALAADRYGSLDGIGDPAAAEVHSELQVLRELLRSVRSDELSHLETADELSSVIESLLAATSP
ncbi:MAG: von Willebrand factor type A domain-containing protein [Chloroflexi bacterium]|nr:von Willebrand factor type A domain-containing protein [Chloroflexota bacterium]